MLNDIKEIRNEQDRLRIILVEWWGLWLKGELHERLHTGVKVSLSSSPTTMPGT